MASALIIYRGLPASGKTTLAKAWVAEDPAHRARVNRDDLRLMLHDGVWLGKDTEQHIVKARDRLIRGLLESGIDVASDDTNLASDVVRQLARVASGSGASVRIVDLTAEVSLEECVARDRERRHPVGEEVIRKMHKRYLQGKETPLPVPSSAMALPPAVIPYEPKSGTPPAIMVDLDGTLCLHNGRSPYDESRVGDDLPNRAVLEVIFEMSEQYEVIFCSGRSENCREATEKWLHRHVGWSAPLFMRGADDKRKDAIVKCELFDKHIRDNYDVRFVLDDRRRVVDAWRGIGLTVFQVAPGEF